MKENMHIEDDPLYNAPTLIIISAAQMPYPGIVVGEKAMEVKPKELTFSIKISRV